MKKSTKLLKVLHPDVQPAAYRTLRCHLPLQRLRHPRRLGLSTGVVPALHRRTAFRRTGRVCALRFVTLSIQNRKCHKAWPRGAKSVTVGLWGSHKVSPWVCGGLEKCRRGFVWVSKSVTLGCGSFDPFEKCHNEVHDVSEYSGASGRGKLPTVGRMGAAGALLIAGAAPIKRHCRHV